MNSKFNEVGIAVLSSVGTGAEAIPGGVIESLRSNSCEINVVYVILGVGALTFHHP